ATFFDPQPRLLAD
nr:RecName: Full=Alpha-1B-glycoprotein; AltName: Full=Alpha-1-B glycoprotein [Oryctolagus cuniculus]